MSIPRRIWRIARDRIRDAGLGDRDHASRRSDAERELEEFLSGHRPSSAPPNDAAGRNGHGPAGANGAAPPPPHHPLARHYRTLGVPVGSDLETVESAWRKLVLQNHPDRFMHDPEQQRRATARLREINAAHEALEEALETRPRG